MTFSEIELTLDDLRTFFVTHLNKIYVAKSQLVDNLDLLKEEAHFYDLKTAIQETAENVKTQIERMNDIYSLLDTQPFSGENNSILGLIEDSFEEIKRHGGQPELRDLSILFYLHNIESIEMASFQLLQMVAVKMKDEKIKQLVHDNYREAKTDRTLLLLITTKYITAVS